MRKKEQLHLAQCDRLKIVLFVAFLFVLSLLIPVSNRFQTSFKQISNNLYY